MNKKIKVIDLLNKISNGEEAPQVIECHGTIWEYNKKERDYRDTGNTRL